MLHTGIHLFSAIKSGFVLFFDVFNVRRVSDVSAILIRILICITCQKGIDLKPRLKRWCMCGALMNIGWLSVREHVHVCLDFLQLSPLCHRECNISPNRCCPFAAAASSQRHFSRPCGRKCLNHTVHNSFSAV